MRHGQRNRHPKGVSAWYPPRLHGDMGVMITGMCVPVRLFVCVGCVCLVSLFVFVRLCQGREGASVTVEKCAIPRDIGCDAHHGIPLPGLFQAAPHAR